MTLVGDLRKTFSALLNALQTLKPGKDDAERVREHRIKQAADLCLAVRGLFAYYKEMESLLATTRTEPEPESPEHTYDSGYRSHEPRSQPSHDSSAHSKPSKALCDSDGNANEHPSSDSPARRMSISAPNGFFLTIDGLTSKNTTVILPRTSSYRNREEHLVRWKTSRHGVHHKDEQYEQNQGQSGYRER
ncbi:hypothetical protein BDV97DRAFT_230554 [Delphinella strobiligena]|nr:hypothetical protein BDV97DRAFT_230554 [Delphinella strobiligena]